MGDLAKQGIVESDALSFTDIRKGRRIVAVHIEGRIDCTSNVTIFVDKWLDVRRNRRGQYEVRGSSYSYNAWLRGSNKQMLRYDSAHGLEELHRHTFDSAGHESREIILLDDLPTLDRVILEAVASARQPPA